jgi:transposase
VWLAKLNERGMLRPLFVPPAQIRQLRDDTRLRSDLTADRARHVQRLEQAARGRPDQAFHGGDDIMGVSGRAMLEALIAGQRDPKVLAELARGRMRGKRAALVAALHGRFDDHHAELARMLLDHIDALGIQIDRLTSRIQELIGAIPAAQPPGDGAGPSGAGPAATTGTQDTDQPLPPTPLSAVQRLDEVPGIGGKAAQVLIAELGLDMAQFPTPGHLVSWARLSPRTIQSGAKRRTGATGKGNPYRKGVLGEVAAAAAKTNTFPWASATAAWSGASANSRPWSPSPAPSW